MPYRHLPVVLLMLLLCSAGATAAPPVLDAPENAYWDAGSDTWFVSNLGGGLSLEKDGVGWVARFDPEGKLLDARWADGLDAPTGMGAHAGQLYVADRGRVHVFDIASGKALRVVELPGAEFVNDVAVSPDGQVYVSDTATNRIYTVTGDRAEVWLESAALQSPNGLWVDGDSLIVASWGPMTDIKTFATKHPGTVLKVNIASKAITAVGAGSPIANFDGIVRIDGHYYATDWTGGRLLRISDTAEVTTVLSGFSQLADLGYDSKRQIIGMPVMSDSRFILWRMAGR